MVSYSALTLFLTLLFGFTTCHLMVVTNSKLPFARRSVEVTYDGDDAIYIFGGSFVRGIDSDWTTEIVKYTLSNGNVEVVGQTPSKLLFHQVAYAGRGSIMYMGGHNRASTYFSDILELNIRNTSAGMPRVGRLEDRCIWHSAVWDGNEHMYIVGGQNDYRDYLDKIIRFTPRTGMVEQVGQLRTWMHSVATAWDDVKVVMYIFGGQTYSLRSTKNITTFDPATGVVTNLNASLPNSISGGRAIWTGKYAYVLEMLSTDIFSVVRFDPATLEVVPVHIFGYPDGRHGTGVVYVPKLRRIYQIGGFEYGVGYTDQIMYIQLDPE